MVDDQRSLVSNLKVCPAPAGVWETHFYIPLRWIQTLTERTRQLKVRADSFATITVLSLVHMLVWGLKWVLLALSQGVVTGLSASGRGTDNIVKINSSLPAQINIHTIPFRYSRILHISWFKKACGKDGKELEDVAPWAPQPGQLPLPPTPHYGTHVHLLLAPSTCNDLYAHPEFWTFAEGLIF